MLLTFHPRPVSALPPGRALDRDALKRRRAAMLDGVEP